MHPMHPSTCPSAHSAPDAAPVPAQCGRPSAPAPAPACAACPTQPQAMLSVSTQVPPDLLQRSPRMIVAGHRPCHRHPGIQHPSPTQIHGDPTSPHTCKLCRWCVHPMYQYNRAQTTQPPTCSSVRSASCSLRWRRKHMTGCASSPSFSPASCMQACKQAGRTCPVRHVAQYACPVPCMYEELCAQACSVFPTPTWAHPALCATLCEPPPWLLAASPA